ILVICFYRELQLVLYNEDLALTLGIQSKLVRNIMLLICGMAIGVVMRLVGALLVDAIILLPALGALQLGSSLATVLVITSLLGLTSTVLGLLIALKLNWPLGVTITLTGVVVLLVITFYRKHREHIRRK
ncbi:MAG: metal ABC transporter permease, partial [Bacillota bacterium]